MTDENESLTIMISDMTETMLKTSVKITTRWRQIQKDKKAKEREREIRKEKLRKKKLKLRYPTVTARLHAEIDEEVTISLK